MATPIILRLDNGPLPQGPKQKARRTSEPANVADYMRPGQGGPSSRLARASHRGRDRLGHRTWAIELGPSNLGPVGHGWAKPARCRRHGIGLLPRRVSGYLRNQGDWMGTAPSGTETLIASPRLPKTIVVLSCTAITGTARHRQRRHRQRRRCRTHVNPGSYEQPLVVPQDGHAKQLPARCICTPHW